MYSKQFLNVCQIKGDLCVRGWDPVTEEYYEDSISYTPYAFIESNTDSEYKSIDGKNLIRKDFSSNFEFQQYKKKLEELDIPLYGMENLVCQYMVDNFGREYQHDKIRIFFLDIENRILQDDGITKTFPNPHDAPSPLTAITIYDSLENRYHVFGDHATWNVDSYKHLDVIYYPATSERELIKNFLTFWMSNYPHIITGWNSESYDIPYLYNRILKLFGQQTVNLLSPWNLINVRNYVDEIGNSQTSYQLYGISHVDYIQVYKKNTFHKQESYKLDFIADVELGKGKIDYREEGYKDLDDLYNRSYQRYIDYNIRDVESLVEIDAKNKFMEIVTGIAHYSTVNYDEVYSVLRCWDSITHRYLYNKKIVSSPRTRKHKKGKFKGAYVKQPVVGLYKWIVTFDLASLYPSIIMSCNIGTETLVEPHNLPPELQSYYGKILVEEILKGNKVLEKHIKKHNLTVAANGMFYTNSNLSTYSILCDDILKERSTDKKRMLELESKLTTAVSPEEKNKLKNGIASYGNAQLVKKVLANSLYGGMGNQFNRYFDVRLAESVTYTGQLVIKWAIIKLDEYFNKLLDTNNVEYCIYSDTDSLFINLEPLVTKLGIDKKKDIQETIDLIDKICVTINNKLVEFYDELSKKINSKNNRFSMKREVIAARTLIRGKKAYAMSVWDKEGVRQKDEFKTKIMGIEVVRADTPKYVRDKLKTSLNMILNGCTESELYDYAENVKKYFFTTKEIDTIASPSGTNSIKKWKDDVSLFKSGTPVHVKAALVHNKYFTENEPINDGDDVRWIYLKKPNPVASSVIAYKDKFPPSLFEYIDRPHVYEKVYYKKLTSLTNLLGWNMSEQSTLF